MCIPLKERIGGERDGDFTDTSNRFNSKERKSKKHDQAMDGYHHHIWSQVTKVAKHRTLKTKIVSHKMTKIFPCVLSGL